MKTIKVKVTAKVVKIIEVEVDEEGLSEEEIHDSATTQANEQFNINADGDEESYEQDAEVIE